MSQYKNFNKRPSNYNQENSSSNYQGNGYQQRQSNYGGGSDQQRDGGYGGQGSYQ